MPPLLTTVREGSTADMDNSIYNLLRIDNVPVREWMRSHHNKHLALMDKFLLDLKLEDNTTSHDSSGMVNRRIITVGKAMEQLRHVMGSTRWKNPAQLLVILRWMGHEMCQACSEPALGNIVRRLMATVREEVNNNGGDNVNTSASDVLWSIPQPHRRDRLGSESDIFAFGESTSVTDKSNNNNTGTSASNNPLYPPIFYENRPELKHVMMEAMEEFINDLQDLHKNINEQAVNHIHNGEVILTCGRSRTVESFLQAAIRKQRSFHVIVVGSPLVAKSLREKLGASNVTVSLVSFAAVFCVMPRVHKVILPAHAVLANGGLVTTVSGSQLVAMAAAHHAVPTIVLTGLYKLCPIFPHDGPDTLNELQQPSIDYATSHSRAWQNVELVQPKHDYIKPEHVSLYITNVGSFQPSFIYRLLAEYYHTDDWDCF